jgi:DNA-binding NarL/FixJ family response regulator
MNDLDGSTKPIPKVLVIDDQILFREGLMSLLRSTPDFELVGSAGSVFEGCEQAALLNPDIILMDFSLPDGTGLDATRRILARSPQCKIVFLTVHGNDENLFSAIRLGAAGYLLKDISSSDLLSSLRELQKGEKAISHNMMSRIVDEFAHIHVSGTSDEKLLMRLSQRELEVVQELEAGATNLEIATHLFLSVNTVKHHVRNIISKLGLVNRRQVAEFARRNGLRGKVQSSRDA